MNKEMEILLVSENFVRQQTNIADNVAGGYLLPAIREAQEMRLRMILGDSLLDRIKELVSIGEIGLINNAAYYDALHKCRYYLAYMAVAMLVQKVAYKITNFGVIKNSDQNVTPASAVEIGDARVYYEARADFYALQLQRFLLVNRYAFKELDDCTCRKIKAHLHSAASCGIYLGGVRGKGRRNCDDAC